MMLDIRELSVVFAGRGVPFTAVDRFSLQMERGEIVGIVGESGSGKSMTAHALMGLIRRSQVTVSGSALFEGADLLRLSREELRRYQGRDMSIIFQEPMTSLNPTMRIGKQVEESLRIHERGLSPAQRRARALDAMALAGLPGPEALYRQYPHQLSGGMRQRVMIAAALVLRPRLLIADEPTTALDVTIQAQILRLMNELQEENGTSIIFITHDLGVINEMADDVAVMYCGQVVEKASARLIFADCAMSHPYTEGLMFSIPRLDAIHTRIEPIPGAVPHPLDLPKGCKFAPRCKYCTQKCIEEEPGLVDVGGGQLIRCFYPEKEVRCSEEHKKITVNQ